ncbi:CCA tRNA nucleotidyltransferase [Staphylococcus auricularis]|uniref:CCA tRNA nucleotidyltransferase n=1 Tax=Staphylococcus auricularis TaxID=29379 RepID=UPI001F3FA44A|nr:CCA tRNA nucleotidyltransferase [Staphylococcus auricularis]MCE5038077.1 CCA tRNA nucleotidyltransferase [Staphylococcus auricularis]MEB6569403.1 CCA tRNA nucleotidyltransferase [Staphylococcus auricularis]
MNTLFEQAKPVLETIKQHGHDAYFVGGAVRDYLMEREIHDVDITTSATPDEIEAIFPKTVPIGKEHGTINVVMEDGQYEVTTFRAEGDYDDHRRPNEVYFVRDLYEDVKRRDFTMNAIAMDSDYQLHDYFHGQRDIEQCVIKTVGPATERFEEDALRILRGLRFQAQLGFSIAPETYEAMTQLIDQLAYLSVERIVVELQKLIAGKHVAESYQYMLTLNAFHYMPFFEHFNMDALTVDRPVAFNDFIALLFVQQSPLAALSELKISNKDKQYINRLAEVINQLPEISKKSTLRRFVYDYGKDLILHALSLSDVMEKNNIVTPSPLIINTQSIGETSAQLPISKRQDLAVTGKDLLDHTERKGGPWVKDALYQLENAVINNQVHNSKDLLLEWMDKHVEIQ